MSKSNKGQFKVTTKAGRIVGYACSKEHAEGLANCGRGRKYAEWKNGAYQNWKYA